MLVPSLSVVAGVGGIGVVLYTVVICIYRLYFHPLSAFHGPKLNAISPFPAAISLLKGRLPMDQKLLHDKYGPVVRISPNELGFNSASAWEDIYGHRQGRTKMAKDPVHAGAVQVRGGVVTMQYEPSDASHSRQRRALAHAFSMRALNEQEALVTEHVTKLIKAMFNFHKAGQAFDLSEWLNFLTFDITGDLTFKEYFGCLDKGDLHFWVALTFDAVKGGAITQATRRLAKAGSSLQRFLLRVLKDVRGPNKEHFELSKAQTLKRLANASDEHRDFLWYVLQQKDRFDITESEIIANSALFILAGSETTSSGLAGLFARLIYNPTKYEALVDEIRSFFSSSDSISHEKLQQLPYLNACINEGLRIHPPIATGLLRSVPREGGEIDGHWIPGGTTVSVAMWASSHNEANWKDAHRFVPERWIDAAYSTDQKKASQPFSLGPRACLGKNLAYMEMRLALGYILWHFDIVSIDGAPLWDPEGELRHMRTYMVWDRPPLMVRAVPVQK